VAQNRLEELADVFAVAVGGFSVLDNHLHVLLRLDPDLAQAWSDEEIQQRLEHVEAQGKTAQLEAAKDGSAAGAQASADLEESLWLCPIEDRRGLDSTREGMIQGFPLGSYAKLVDYTGRLFRQGKASISAELAGIFERLNCNAQSWHKRMERLGGDRLLGRFFASTRAKLREIGERLGVRHLVNLTGCPLR
jgi:hypothetical protein